MYFQLLGEVVVGFGGAAGPVATRRVGDGEEGTPVVGDAVVNAGRQGRVATAEGSEVVVGPAGEFAAEDVFDLVVAAVEPGADLVRFGFEKQDADGAVVEGLGQVADAGEDGGGKGVEGAHGVASAFATVGAGALFVAGIEQAAQFVVGGKVGVDFVQEQGGLVLVDEAEEDGGVEVLGADGWSCRTAVRGRRGLGAGCGGRR